MKKITVIISFFALTISNATAQEEYRGALGLHPTTNMISWRSNNLNKRFMDYKLSYKVGSVSGVPFFNLSPQVNICWRKQNHESVKLYWGLGLGLETFVPRFSVPLGIEFFPLKSTPQVSIGAEASPELIFLGPGLMSTTIQGDFAIRYYFNEKVKNKK